MRASSVRRSTRLTCAAIWAALGGRGRSSWLNTSRSCGTVSAGIFPPKPPPLQLQEPQRQQRERYVVVPAHPRAHLVLPQPHLAFARPEQHLDLVPLAVDCRQLGQRHLRRRGTERVPDARLLSHRAQDHQALARAGAAVLVLGPPRTTPRPRAAGRGLPPAWPAAPPPARHRACTRRAALEPPCAGPPSARARRRCRPRPWPAPRPRPPTPPAAPSTRRPAAPCAS